MKQKKIDHTTCLPEKKISEVFGYLEEKSQSNLALTNKMFGHSVFQQDRIKAKLFQHIRTDNLKKVVELLRIRPDLRPLMNSYLESKQVELFKLAGFAEQDKMKVILESYPELFYVYDSLEDISNVDPIINKEGRKPGITLFQHAVWAGDVRYMCNMMLDCLLKIEDGEKIRVELLRQYEELMEHGVVYVLDGKLHYETQFSLQLLLDGLSHYVTHFKGWTCEEQELHWCKDVGLPQNRLTAHFRHHYCDPKDSFWNAPDFTKPELIRSLRFYNYVTDEVVQLWDDCLLGLGSDFAIAGEKNNSGAGRRSMPPRQLPGGARAAADVDLRSLVALCEVRTKTDLPALIMRLNSPIQSPEIDQIQSPGTDQIQSPETDHKRRCVIS